MALMKQAIETEKLLAIKFLCNWLNEKQYYDQLGQILSSEKHLHFKDIRPLASLGSRYTGFIIIAEPQN